MTGFLRKWAVGWRPVFILIGLLTGVQAQAQMGFQVSPSKLYISQAGQREQTVQVHLKNTMDSPLTLQSSCADWRRDSTGNKVYALPGTLPTSCCSLVRITPSLIQLAPREERDVLVTVQTNGLPNDGLIRTGMLFLTQINEPTVTRIQASQIIVKIQIGVMIYVMPREGSQPVVAIKEMRVHRAGDRYQVAVTIRNEGRALGESQLRLEYLNLQTKEEEKTEPVPVNTMPNDAFRVVSVVPAKLPAGKYLIVAILDSGPGQALKVAELETVLK